MRRLFVGLFVARRAYTSESTRSLRTIFSAWSRFQLSRAANARIVGIEWEKYLSMRFREDRIRFRPCFFGRIVHVLLHETHCRRLPSYRTTRARQPALFRCFLSIHLKSALLW